VKISETVEPFVIPVKTGTQEIREKQTDWLPAKAGKTPCQICTDSSALEIGPVLTKN
jgi:hypothetical protein